MRPAELLDELRQGRQPDAQQIDEMVRGAVDGSWSEAQLGAFLMAVAIHGFDTAGISALTDAMLRSGDSWQLRRDVPGVIDKHSTGGVGDKTSLIMSPLLAVCGVPVAMLTGRALGHTGGTADKLETIPGLDLDFDRARCLELLDACGVAIGIATEGIAPADRILYGLRDRTGTVPSLTLVTSSILSKKLATGAAAITFDVKVGNGAIFPDVDAARALAESMVGVCRELGVGAGALLSDMNQPLGRWSGGACEVNESLEILAGGGDARLRELVLDLSEDVALRAGTPVERTRLEQALADGTAHRRFLDWALQQGADPAWVESPALPLAPVEFVVEAPHDGVLAEIATRDIGWLLGEAAHGEDRYSGVALEQLVQLGDIVEKGQPLARWYWHTSDAGREERARAAFRVDAEGRGEAPPLVWERVG